MPNVSTTLTRLGNSNFYNLKDFNQALGNGADATSALNAALSALGTKSGTILIPDGTYGLSSQVTYQMAANQHIVIEGEGNARLVSTISEPGSEGGILQFTGDSGVTAKLTLRRLKISHTNSGLGKLDGLYVLPLNYPTGTQSLSGIFLEDVEISGASLWGCDLLGVLSGVILKCKMSGNRDGGLGLTGCQNIAVLGGDYSTNVTGNTSGDYGISAGVSSSFLPYSQNILVSGVQANNNGRKGIDIHHAHNVHIKDNFCIGNGEVGIYAVMESTSKDVGSITISGNTIDQTGGNASLVNLGIQIGTFGTTGALDPGTFLVSNNRIRNVDTGTTTSHAIRIMTATSGVAPQRVVISDNTVYRGTGPTGWIILSDNNLAIPELEITNNILHTTSCASGILIQQATDVNCSGNIIRIDSGTANNGISLPSGANSICVGNQINGSAPTTVLANSGSATYLSKANQQNGTALSETSAGGFTVDTNGHLLSTVTGTPTLSSVNANVTNQSVSGNDVRGVVSFDTQTGTITTGSALFTINFAHAYGSAPIVVLTTGPSVQFTAGFIISAASTSGFTIRNGSTLAVLTGYKVQYMVIG